ncbi:gephyrin-like molybdotransferase Glp [Kordiimonas sp.]|uniref:molybdopterin molybdotransferase MoeA n=1 Tax=Kordiimonas sp. TaxID=1970157 RepID=UPI003A8DFA58
MNAQAPIRSDTLVMQSYTDSLAAICDTAEVLAPHLVPLSAALGKVLAADIHASIAVPSFENSAMDGFAFASADVAAASEDAPVSLLVVGASIAGDTAGLSHLVSGRAAKIMTGAPMPDGADTVMPVEAASWDHENLTFTSPYPKGRHVRLVGQDIATNDLLLEAGTRIKAAHLPMLCASGAASVMVFERPKACWISTGQEISDDFTKPLAPGHIYNATALYGQSACEDMGVEFTNATTVRDTPQDFAAALETALEGDANIILSTGGVSAGQYDFVKPVLEDFGARIHVHRVRIKPAKPILFATLPGGKYFFGLPGNPISTALALGAFVKPFAHLLSGVAHERSLAARLINEVRGASGKTTFLMGKLTTNETGQLHVTADARQQSFQTAPFGRSDAWIVIPEGVDALAKGELVDCIPFTSAICDRS